MQKQAIWVTLPICVAILVAGAWLANAGDLNPPAGPVAPTMATLDQVYAAVTTPQPCPECTWEYAHASLPTGGPHILVVPGSGVFHGFWMTKKATMTVYDGDPNSGGQVIGYFFYTENPSNPGYNTKFWQLDVAFQNGLYMNASPQGSETSVTVLYRSTP